MRFALLFLICTALASSTAAATSFDCSKAVNAAEKIACSTPDISQLDDALAAAYNAAQARSSDRAALAREQRLWLARRNACGSDQACIRAAYESRLAAIASAEEPASAPLTTLAQIASFRPQSPIVSYGDRLVFSQYDNSGNNFDIVAFDIANQSSDYVLRGRPAARFVAQNDKYLVFSERGRFANVVQVVERRSGKRLGQINLRLGISWAKIEGERLIAIQGDSLSAGYATKTPALVLALPTLKLVKSVEIVGGNDTQSWDGKILSLGHDLAAYDNELNEIFKISLPARKRGDRVSCAATWPLRVYKDKAVIVANCGEILVYDLPSRRLERTIPSYGHFYAVAVLDGLIFTAPTSEPRQRDSAHVYDLYTGRELAVLPINATGLFVKGTRLLAVERESDKPSPMTLYSVNSAALRNGQWRSSEVVTQCQKAAALADAGDLYGAIRLCESAGVEGIVDEAKSSSHILAVVRQYGLWLAKTFDRTGSAAAVLDKVREIMRDPAIDTALAEARLKNRVLEGKDPSPLTKEEQQTAFGLAVAAGARALQSETRNIEFGAFSNIFLFSEDRLYVGGYGCSRCSVSGASIAVLDRGTLEQLGHVQIAPRDDEYQDAIRSIAADENRIYVSVEYRYEQAGRPNFVVVDKASLQVVKKTHVNAPPTLHVERGRLLACGCSFTLEQSCVTLDPITTRMASEPGAVCAPARGFNDTAVAHLQSGGRHAHHRFFALTNDYLVGHPLFPKDAPYVVYPRQSGQPVSMQLHVARSLDWPASISGNSILITEATRNAQILKLVSVPTGKTETLMGIPTSRLRTPIPLLHDQTLFIGLGHDLIVFDVQKRALRRYIRDFIPAPFQDNGSGLDRNVIGRLMTDRGRLIALTLYGENSRIVSLADL
jgi:uncharacterized protein YecT (DUF1311 family)